MFASPAAAVYLIVLGSTALRLSLASKTHVPWILPDEIVYSDIAKSFAAGHLPAVRGVRAFGWGEIYPILISPAWLVFDDLERAYTAVLAINALLMSLAAVPAYLLARSFVSIRSGLIVAAASVVLPSMAYTGVVMTENAFYPAFLTVVLVIVRALERPTTGRQLLVLLAIVLLVVVRTQGIALFAAYASAILLLAALARHGERMSHLRPFLISGFLGAVGLVVVPGISTLHGSGPLGWLGDRSGTFAVLHVSEIPQWYGLQAAELTLYLAVVPVAATVVVVVQNLRRCVDERLQRFSVLTVTAVFWALLLVALVSASLDVDGHENVNERYLFYLTPLLLTGLALWVEGGLQRPWRLTATVVLACAVGTALIPFERLAYNARFQSLALVPLLELPLSGWRLGLVVGSTAAICGLFWASVPARHSSLLWLVVVAWFAIAGARAIEAMSGASEWASSLLGSPQQRWVDRALPGGARAVVLWDERDRGLPGLDPLYAKVMLTEFFNRRVGLVYRIGPGTHYESFLPTRPVQIVAGTVLEAALPLEAKFVVAPCTLDIDGERLGSTSDGSLVLYRPSHPLRAQARTCSE